MRIRPQSLIPDFAAFLVSSEETGLHMKTLSSQCPNNRESYGYLLSDRKHPDYTEDLVFSMSNRRKAS